MYLYKADTEFIVIFYCLVTGVTEFHSYLFCQYRNVPHHLIKPVLWTQLKFCFHLTSTSSVLRVILSSGIRSFMWRLVCISTQLLIFCLAASGSTSKSRGWTSSWNKFVMHSLSLSCFAINSLLADRIS